MTRAHLIEIIALMGHPSPELLKKGKRTTDYFDEDGENFSTRTTLFANPAGQWQAGILVPDRMSLAEFEANLEASNKEAILRFVWKVVQWRPEGRQTANDAV